MTIHTPLALTLVAIATAATMIFITLGHLSKPTRASALWTATFAELMVGSYVWIAADVVGSIELKAVSNGLVLGSMALMWSGLRAYRGVASRAAISVAVVVGFSLVLLLVAGGVWYAITFRCVFVATGVFAALTIVEAWRLGRTVRDEVLPLVVVASLYLVFAGVIVVDGALVATGVTAHADSLAFIRGVNLLGSNVFVVCALVTFLQLTTRDGTVRENSPDDIFSIVARERLVRAQDSEDPWWSFVDIRLDNPHDIRVASNTAMFDEIIDRFRREVYASLPADADIRPMSPAQIVALVPRAQGGMREILSETLRKVSSIDTPESFPIRLSASAGWAHAATGGYNLDTLLEMTGAAVLRARDQGGDRWERVPGDR